jgi:hypothetical protein
MPKWLTSAQQKRPQKMKRNKQAEQGRTPASLVAKRAKPILEEAVGAARPLTPDEVLAKVRQLGLSTPPGAAATIRKDRDGR